MISLIKNLVLLSVLGLSFHAKAYALKPCTTCFGDVTDTQLIRKEALECPARHRIDQECLTHQVKSHEDLKALRTHGLGCCGVDVAGDACKHKFPFGEAWELLASTEKIALQTRFDRAASPVDSPRLMTDVDRLKLGITESFVIQCPAEGCGAACDRIGGCNAAQCQSEECGNRFCYLCLESQEDNVTGHAHARAHSNDYWEQRPGYLERYHWLLARKNLAALLRSKVEDTTRTQALDESQVLLKEKKMWPMPAGLAAGSWLEQVRSNAELTPAAKIELLQNEAIYRRQMKDKKNEDLVEAEIRRLGGLVLASLDVKDAAGIGGPTAGAGIAALRVAQVAALAPDLAQPVHPVARAAVQVHQPVAAPHPVAAHGIAPVLEHHPRFNQLSPQFRALGNMYEVGHLIWSGVAPGTMNQQGAVAYCASRGGGARLPTKDEYIALSRAMGSRQPDRSAPGYDSAGYNVNLIPDTNNRWFWSASRRPRNDDGAFYFAGNVGGINYFSSRIGYSSVRCVVGG